MGFDFLGYHHTPMGCTPSGTTYARFYAQLIRLYEQGADRHRIGVYRTRWWRWVRSGLPEGWVLVKQVPPEIRWWREGVCQPRRVTLWRRWCRGGLCGF